jgi:hypothetical protein
MAVPIQTDIGIRRVGTAVPVVAPSKTPSTAPVKGTVAYAIAGTPVNPNQPTNQIFQAVNGSVWRYNPSTMKWQMAQATPSPQLPTSPKTVGTITSPIAGKPGAFVTTPNTANPTAPGIVSSTPVIPTPSNLPPPTPPPSTAASYNAPTPPVQQSIFFKPSVPLGTVAQESPTPAATVQVSPGPGSSMFPWIILAVLALVLFSNRSDQ